MEFNLLCYARQKKSDDVKHNIRVANLRETLSNVDWVSLLSTLNTNDARSLFKSIFQKVIDDVQAKREEKCA